ncbi:MULTISPECIES: GNAT family N-acetyltransferase [unclassified Halomonas]|uniref:GNAT family N-acetyltransferase n=1 Tax=Halomonas sp. N3-2A TaxID=2014541 RepID=UPI0018DF4815|nr:MULTISPECIES: GNAT family N-acetyltransferase [unclassified Halomonas]UTD54610.1 GNAT family N-acetyltransferase [Halomonas sp. MS1]
MTNEKIMLEKCDVKSLDELVEVGRSTYLEAFKSYCSDEVMKTYLDQAFERNKIRQEIMNEDSEFYFIRVDDELAGYLKLNVNSAQSDLKNENGLEIERIYVKAQYKSRGLGKIMLSHGVKRAKELIKSFAWLGVWEKNLAAIDFYKKNGFYEFGSHRFIMGNEVQNDFIMKKEIN